MYIYIYMYIHIFYFVPNAAMSPQDGTPVRAQRPNRTGTTGSWLNSSHQGGQSKGQKPGRTRSPWSRQYLKPEWSSSASWRTH